MDNDLKTAALTYVKDPSPIKYYDVYHKGDEWIKTQGCEACSLENRVFCCGNGSCKMLLLKQGECRLHIDDDGRQKPFYCVVYPPPNVCHAWCALEFKCTKGPLKGSIRRVKDKRGVLFKPDR